MRIVYVANDGTMFDEELLCERYEREEMFTKCGDAFLAYNRDKELIPGERLIRDSDCISVIKVSNVHGLEILEWIVNETGYCFLDDALKDCKVYFENGAEKVSIYYDELHEEWFDIDEVKNSIAEWTKTLELMEK